MTACFWADDPFGPVEPSDNDSRTRCPTCDTPVTVVVGHGPTEHVASPCGCRVPGDLLEEATAVSDLESDGW